MTAYERWEMASFDTQPAGLSAGKQPATQEFVGPPRPLPPSPVELDRIRQAAHDKGFAEGQETGHAEGLQKGSEEGRQQGWEIGHKEGMESGVQEGTQAGLTQGREEGHKEGFATGLAEGEQEIRRIASELNNLISSLGQSVLETSNSMAPALLDLALDVARAMTKSALKARPEIVIDVIRDAISALPETQGPLAVYLHPEDITLVNAHLAQDATESNWKLIADDTIERGGCRITTAANQVNAENQTRWKRIAESLGKQSDWLA